MLDVAGDFGIGCGWTDFWHTVPGMNDGEVERIGDFCKLLSSLKRLRALGYHDFARSKYADLGMAYPLPDTPMPSEEDIRSVIEKLVSMGVPAFGSDDL